MITGIEEPSKASGIVVEEADSDSGRMLSFNEQFPSYCGITRDSLVVLCSIVLSSRSQSFTKPSLQT